MPYRKVRRLLRSAGFHEVRQKGSHVFYRHEDGRTTEVPHHGRDIPSSLVGKILKDAGLDPDKLRPKA
ncbi:MAG: type II toxin-antitoxin system HicA family toxin [Thermoplasmatota archaeon]|nr:type II toxin-antitoxin system HicA family toxin [Halobacteriales archaeon]